MADTYEPIATTTLTTATATVSFTSIPSTYTHLVFIGTLANNNADAATTGAFRINSDSGGNYSSCVIYTEGNTPTSFRTTSATVGEMWTITGNTDTNRKGVVTIHFNNYSDTSKYKSWVAQVTTPSSTAGYATAWGGLWKSTSAISRIDFGYMGIDWLAGSQFTLYGIKAA